MLEKILAKKAFLNFFLLTLSIGGVLAFASLGKLEDPEIPVKAAVVITPYPGASALEVEREITDVLEKAIQRLENIDHIESRSLPGLSEITIYIESGVHTEKLPQLWDHLRRKVNDARRLLPYNAYEPIINDDFGDVLGIFMAITNDGHNYYDFQKQVDIVRQKLLLVPGVKRIEEFGKKREVINIIFDNDYFATLGINPMVIFQAFNDQGNIVDAGNFSNGGERIRIHIGNKFQDLNEIKNFEVSAPNGGRYKLGDIARVERAFEEPVRQKLKYNNLDAISLAISMESGGNIIELGDAIEKELKHIEANMPIGIEYHPIFYQHKNVSESIDDFVINLVESVLIVIGVLLLAMGLKAGLLIASGLIFTILGTFIVMSTVDIELHKVSLAAIIIAMGMLVDNAIVIADGILIDIQKGLNRKAAFVNTTKKAAMPLLGATLVAILAFLPLAFNPTGAGEFLKPLFYVLAISLFISWLLAMVQTPFMAQYFYTSKNKVQQQNSQEDLYTGKFYQFFNRLIKFALWHKTLFTIATLLILILSFWTFKYVKKDFFPGLVYDQFILDYRLPEGTDIKEVESDLQSIQSELNNWEKIDYVVTALGSSPARYTLSRPMNGLSGNYGELIISVTDKAYTKEVIEKLQTYVNKNYPQAMARVREYIAIGGDFKIEAKFSGPDETVLKSLAEQAKLIMHQEPKAQFVTDNWKNPVKVLVPQYSQQQARSLMVSRSDVAKALAVASSGYPVGAFYDGEYQLPVLLKLNRNIEDDISLLPSIPVWSQRASSISMSQVTDSILIKWENNMINRYDGERAIKVQCDPVLGVTGSSLLPLLKDKIDEIPLPAGYKLTWLGEVKSSKEANDGLAENLPLTILLMIIIIIGLFNNFKQPIIIFLLMPLAFIGVIFGFLVTGNYFGFFSIVGTLGLMGMMIKNAVVLLDEINLQIKDGEESLNAIINATTSRVRPVMMASLTTILGMLPLMFDDMFKTMATAIMFGLLIGSIITLIVIPVLYAVFYKVNTKQLVGNTSLSEQNTQSDDK